MFYDTLDLAPRRGRRVRRVRERNHRKGGPPMDSSLAALGARPEMYEGLFEESAARPDFAEMANEAGEAWPMMGHVARLAASVDDEGAWGAGVCAGGSEAQAPRG